MDYEKKYNNVVNKFAYLLESTDLIKGELRQDIESIFPELKESEDERIRKALINTFKYYHTNESPYMDGISNESVVAYLEKQVEQDPAWSEEDDIRLNATVSFLERYKGIDYENTGVCISWLKSLKERYTWKPSEEQMNALHYVTNFDYGGHKATLVSLYEQLKKLRKE